MSRLLAQGINKRNMGCSLQIVNGYFVCVRIEAGLQLPQNLPADLMRFEADGDLDALPRYLVRLGNGLI